MEHFNAEGLASPTVPLSHGVIAADWLYVSGMVARTDDGEILQDDVEAATLLCLENMREVLETAGARIEDVAKINVYLADMGDYTAMNAGFVRFFDVGAYPARTTIQAGALGLGTVELDAVAHLGSGGDGSPLT